MILKLILNIIKWCKEHIKEVIAAAFGLGAVAAADGAVHAHKAKKINKRALQIQQEAIQRHSAAYEKTETVLAELGKAEKTVIDSFIRFADSMEKIQGRPKFKNGLFSSVKLPTYEPEEIKVLSNNLQMALGGIGGAGTGALVGLAAFGAGALVVAPAALGFGVVLCTKGRNLKNKAVENVRQANQLTKDVDTIVAFYGKVNNAVVPFTESMWAVYKKYDSCLNSVEMILSTKTTWKELSHSERKLVENTIYLARLLHSMCQTQIIEKHDSEEKLETINITALAKLENQASKLLAAV